MNVCHFSAQDIAGGGGGFQAAYRIHDGIRQAGCRSLMVVSRKESRDQDVWQIGNQKIDSTIRLKSTHASRRILRLLLGINTPFDTGMSGVSVGDLIPFVQDIQIIHLHWISGFLSSSHIKRMALVSKAPIVWTLMDLAPLTGGCHYTGGCSGYVSRCGRCPQTRWRMEHDISRRTWQRKAADFKDSSIVVVAPTQWVAERAKESSLMGGCRIARIPLPVDDRVFTPLDSHSAREILGLGQNKKLIFFGAYSMSEKRKGFSYLAEALRFLELELSKHGFTKDQVALVVAGDGNLDNAGLPFEIFRLGVIRDESALALAYQAADLFVCPSIEDAGPMMIPEAMMCGTPVVAFNMGGAPDLIRNMENGYLAKYKDVPDLARGMALVLSRSDHPAMRNDAREAAMRNHSPTVVAAQYIDLYRSLSATPG